MEAWLLRGPQVPTGRRQTLLVSRGGFTGVQIGERDKGYTCCGTGPTMMRAMRRERRRFLAEAKNDKTETLLFSLLLSIAPLRVLRAETRAGVIPGLGLDEIMQLQK